MTLNNIIIYTLAIRQKKLSVPIIYIYIPIREY